MKFVNMTSRTITIVDDLGVPILSLPPSGNVIGSKMEAKVHERFNFGTNSQFDLVSYNYHSVTGLPQAEHGVWIVVTYAVLQALQGQRPDVISPDTSPGSIVREPGSQKVLGVRGFRKL